MPVYKERAIAELYGVSQNIISDPETLFQVAQEIAADLQLTVVDRVLDHRYTPVGTSAGVIMRGELPCFDGLALAESHYFWHTWPEEENGHHLSIDVYSCSSRINLSHIAYPIVKRYKPRMIGFEMVPTPEVRGAFHILEEFEDSKFKLRPQFQYLDRNTRIS